MHTQCGLCGDPINDDNWTYNDQLDTQVHDTCDNIIERLSTEPSPWGICSCGNQKDVDEDYCDECCEEAVNIIAEWNSDYLRSVRV